MFFKIPWLVIFNAVPKVHFVSHTLHLFINDLLISVNVNFTNTLLQSEKKNGPKLT